MTDLSQVTYCGLYCGLCVTRNRMPRQAGELRETMRKEGWESWGQQVPGFNEFWSFLNGIADGEENCSCRGGTCGPSFCSIRTCAPEKGVEVCPFCDEYPCYRIEGLAKGYVNLIADGYRMRLIGPDAWIAEQEQRRRTGFAYTDIRNHPYSIPE